MPVLATINALEKQRGQLFAWAPVWVGAGILTFLSLGWEPSVKALILNALLGAGLLAVGLRLLRHSLVGVLPIALALLALGGSLAGARLHLVAGPVLSFRYYGPVQGRVIAIDRSASDKTRLTLDRVILSRVDPGRTPRRVRISLHGDQRYLAPLPGQVVAMTAHLSAPQGPTEPGGFDFRRHAFFQGLGAVGYTRVPALLLARPPPGPALWLHRTRHALADRIRAALPGRVGGFSAAIVTGDRSSLDADTLTDLRRTNLAHLLAISGLHMGLVTGLVLGAVRLALALVPRIALYHPARKIAAVAALLVAAGYLALSGANVATQRAFVMVAVMLVALILDRRAISLRAVALAALIVMVLRPESVAGPGFQMSFAATTALVTVFAWLRDRRRGMPPGGRVPRVLAPVAALALSSLIAGLATAPIAAAHFNMVSRFGYPANLVSVPVMGILVMPGGILAVLGMPLGLEGAGLALMRLGVGWILGVAGTVSAWPDAVSHLPTPPAATLGVVVVGGLLLCLLRGGLRLVGLPVLLAGGLSWAGAERPALLISESGGLVGVMAEGGRVLSRARGEGFVARTWLENDGDGRVQEVAVADPPGGVPRLGGDGPRVVHLRGKKGAARLDEACGAADLVVWDGFPGTGETPARPPGCKVLTAGDLRRLGAVAGHIKDGRLQLTGAREVTGPRLWTRDGMARGRSKVRSDRVSEGR